MAKKELLALAAIVASAYGMDSSESEQSLIKCGLTAYSDMREECFIK